MERPQSGRTAPLAAAPTATATATASVARQGERPWLTVTDAIVRAEKSGS